MSNDNKLFNSLFDEPTVKKEQQSEQPNKQDDLSRLSLTLDKLRNLLPFKKAQGVRPTHKYIKRTGAPGNYKYWYQNPQTGEIYAADKPQNSAHGGINADKEQGFHDTVKTVTVQAKNPTKGWSSSSKVPNTINHSQHGSVSVIDNSDGTKSVKHNGSVVRDLQGNDKFKTKEEANSFVKEYVNDLGEKRLSQHEGMAKKVIVKKKE